MAFNSASLLGSEHSILHSCALPNRELKIPLPASSMPEGEFFHPPRPIPLFAAHQFRERNDARKSGSFRPDKKCLKPLPHDHHDYDQHSTHLVTSPKSTTACLPASAPAAGD
jgi:hypothetical protein